MLVCSLAVTWNNLPSQWVVSCNRVLICLMPQFSPVRSVSIWVSIYWGHQRTIYLALVPSPLRPRTLEAPQISFRLAWFNHKPRLFDTNEIISLIEHQLLENLDGVIIIRRSQQLPISTKLRRLLWHRRGGPRLSSSIIIVMRGWHRASPIGQSVTGQASYWLVSSLTARHL